MRRRERNKGYSSRNTKKDSFLALEKFCQINFILWRIFKKLNRGERVPNLKEEMEG